MPVVRLAGDLIPELAVYQRRLLTGGVAGLAVCAIGAFFQPAQFFESYLLAYMFCLSITLGCLALGMVHQLSGGAWGIVIRRPVGAAIRLLPVMTLLFIPVLAGMGHLYVWTRTAPAHDELLAAKHLYLNTPFFVIRAALYFTAWNVIGGVLNRWAVEQDRTGDPEVARRMQKLSAGGLVVYCLTITFASFDWLMSLEPHWYSTIYGVLIMGGQGVTALAFLICVLVWLSARPPLDAILVKAHFHDLGNLLLAFVMLWAYFAFSQYLIIWAGNLPEEIAWYVHRLQTGWRLVGLFLVLFHFAVPFVLLLSRTIKRERELIAKVAIGILVMRLVDLFWLIAPEFHTAGIRVSWLDVLLPLSLGGCWLGLFIREFRRRTLLPTHDPEFDEALGPIVNQAARGT